jgi:hypothetical protein
VRHLVLRLEQRRVAGREPPSEQRSEGQPGYLGESLLHLHPHRAPISATQPTDLLVTGIRATRSRAMDIRATRDTPLTPVLRATHTQATRVAPLTPVLRGMDCRATRDTPPTPVPRPMDTRAARHTLPVPVMDIPCLVIPETALRRTGRLGPSTLSSLLAELRPRIHPQCLTPLAAGESERLRKIDCPCKGWALNLRSAPIGTTVSRGSALTPGPGGLASRASADVPAHVLPDRFATTPSMAVRKLFCK